MMDDTHRKLTDLELARKSAWILGAMSAAAQAVDLYDRLVADGKRPQLLQERGRWIVIHDSKESRAAAAMAKETE